MPDSPPQLDMARLPRHIAIIMDGNGRWAKRRLQPRLFGHKVGAESVRDIVETCRELGISNLTLYAFSSENWNRPDQEVSGLMGILRKYLESELPRMLQNDVRLRAIGDISRLPITVGEYLAKVIDETRTNQGLTLNLALSYGSRDELVRATRSIAARCLAGELRPEQITEHTIEESLDTAGQPPPDLMIRTGGEARLSNFLLWQLSYAEIYFTPTMWPEFRRANLIEAIASFQAKERRFGRTGEQLHSESS